MHAIPLICFFLLLPLATSVAQVGVADVAVHPKLHPHIMQWGRLGDSLRIRIANSDTIYHSIKLPVTISVRKTLVADLDTFLMPPVSLAPGVSTFYAEDIIRPEAIRLHRFDERHVLPGGRLLPGEYTLCIGGPCRQFRVDPWPALRVVAPAPGDTVPLRGAIALRWSNVALYPEDQISYRIKLVPLLPGEVADTAIRHNSPLFDHTVTNATEWLWDGKNVPASVQACAWSVQALDEEGVPITEWTPPSVMILAGGLGRGPKF